MIAAGTLHVRFRTLPATSIDGLLGSGTALILAPHADDESLGCGGLIAACCEAGRPPLLALLTDGCGSHPNSRTHPPERLRATREAELLEAVGGLGLAPSRVSFLRQPDTALAGSGPGLDEVVERLAALARSEPVTRVLTTWRHDPHCDHEAAAAIGTALARRLGTRLLFYPVWGWCLPADTQLPNEGCDGWRLPIAAFLTRKDAAVAAHRSQHGGLITDDPDGFTLPAHLLDVFRQPFEVFLCGEAA